MLLECLVQRASNAEGSHRSNKLKNGLCRRLCSLPMDSGISFLTNSRSCTWSVSFGFWRFRIGARGSQRARMPDGSRSEAPALLASCIKGRMGSKNSFLFKVFSTGLVRLLRQLLRGFPGHLLRSNASSERDRRWSYSRNCRQAPRARIQEKPGHQGARFIEGTPVKDWEVVFRIFIPLLRYTPPV